MKNLAIKLALVAMTALGLAACDKGGGNAPAKDKPAAATKAPATGATAPTGGHAPADVVPGSHEDWCEEHQVPESQCTQCNPELVPAFKATHDWCDEHGLPESHCKKCNPDLVIARPAKKE